MTTPYREEIRLPQVPYGSPTYTVQLDRALYDQFRDDHKRLGAIERSLGMVPRVEKAISTTSLTALSIRSTGTGAFDLYFANTENLTADRTLTLAVSNGNKTLTLTGSPSLSGITTTGTGTLSLTSGKTLTVTNTLDLQGTDSTSHIFPSTSSTLARIDAAQSFSGLPTFQTGIKFTGSTAVTAGSGAASMYHTSLNIFTIRGGASGVSFLDNAGANTNVSWTDGGNVTVRGTISSAGMAATELTGTIAAARMPALTGDVTTSAGAVATTIGATKVTSAMLNSDVYSTAHSWGGTQTFTAPVLGTPGSGTLTNCTGLPVAGVVGLSTAWDSYTPTIGTGFGAFTTVSAAGRYKQIGKTVDFKVVLTITNQGTAASYITLTLPVTAQANQGALCGSSSTSGVGLSVTNDTATIYIFKYDGTYYGPSGSVLTVTGTYEAA